MELLHADRLCLCARHLGPGSCVAGGPQCQVPVWKVLGCWWSIPGAGAVLAAALCPMGMSGGSGAHGTASLLPVGAVSVRLAPSGSLQRTAARVAAAPGAESWPRCVPAGVLLPHAARGQAWELPSHRSSQGYRGRKGTGDREAAVGTGLMGGRAWLGRGDARSLHCPDLGTVLGLGSSPTGPVGSEAPEVSAAPSMGSGTSSLLCAELQHGERVLGAPSAGLRGTEMHPLLWCMGCSREGDRVV